MVDFLLAMMCDASLHNATDIKQLGMLGRLHGGKDWGVFIMSFIPNNDRDRVLEATDLVGLMGEHVVLRQKGREHVGLCPFHDDQSPSLHVVSHKGTPFYKCFACGEGGNAFDFVINYHKMSFIEALRFLAERAGIELTPRTRNESPGNDEPQSSRSEVLAANELAAMYFSAVLKHEKAGRPCRDIIEARGISQDMVERFAIGATTTRWDGFITFARKRQLSEQAMRDAGLAKQSHAGAGLRDAFINRLIFPIHDPLGRAIAFGGRQIDPEEQPKYLNSAESPVFSKSKTLYGFHLARKAIDEANCAIVTEGYTDVIALHQAGIEHAVATLGTALTRDHAKVLQRHCDSVILLFDGDAAGQKAADRAVEVFFAEPIDVRICILPDDADPDELLKQEDGKQQLLAMLDDATDALGFLIQQFKTKVDASETISGRQKQIEAIFARLADLGYHSMSGLRKRLVLPALSDLLQLPIEQIEKSVPVRRQWNNPAPIIDEAEEDHDTDTAVEEPDWEALSLSQPRRKAERNLLAVIIYNPQTLDDSVDAGDGHMLPLTEAYLPESFADTSCRAIYSRLLELHESDELITVATIQRELPNDACQQTVLTLYFHGQQLCEDNEPRAHHILGSITAGLDAVRDRESSRSRMTEIRSSQPDESQPAFIRILEERRQLGRDPVLLPRGVRQ